MLNLPLLRLTWIGMFYSSRKFDYYPTRCWSCAWWIIEVLQDLIKRIDRFKILFRNSFDELKKMGHWNKNEIYLENKVEFKLLKNHDDKVLTTVNTDIFILKKKTVQWFVKIPWWKMMKMASALISHEIESKPFTRIWNRFFPKISVHQFVEAS